MIPIIYSFHMLCAVYEYVSENVYAHVRFFVCFLLENSLLALVKNKPLWDL